jgi:hypothetical protein
MPPGENTRQKKHPALPRSFEGEDIALVPARTAFARTRDTTVSTSTEIVLNENTTLLEITAITDHLYMKYGTDDVSNANFDEFILANSTRHYVVPAGVTAINLIDNGSSGAAIVIEK